MDTFRYISRWPFIDPLRVGVEQELQIDTICTPSGPIHDTGEARSLSGEVNIKTHWGTVEEWLVEIPCIKLTEYWYVREMLFSIATGPFVYDATNQPFVLREADVKLKKSALPLKPVAPRSTFTSTRFTLEPTTLTP